MSLFGHLFTLRFCGRFCFLCFAEDLWGATRLFNYRLSSLQGSQGSSASLSSTKVSSSVENGDGAVNEGEACGECSMNLPSVGRGDADIGRYHTSDSDV